MVDFAFFSIPSGGKPIHQKMKDSIDMVETGLFPPSGFGWLPQA
jgi:hypothetical protein